MLGSCNGSHSFNGRTDAEQAYWIHENPFRLLWLCSPLVPFGMVSADRYRALGSQELVEIR